MPNSTYTKGETFIETYQKGQRVFIGKCFSADTFEHIKEVNLNNILLVDVDFNCCIFQTLILEDIKLFQVRLNQIKGNKISLKNVEAEEAYFNYNNFFQLEATNSTFIDCSFSENFIIEGDFTGSAFDKNDFFKTTIRKTNFKDTEFLNTNFKGTSIEESDFTGARFDEYTLETFPLKTLKQVAFTNEQANKYLCKKLHNRLEAFKNINKNKG